MAGCCGGKSKAARSSGGNTPKSAPAPMPGANGMQLLEYAGSSDSDITWYGPETGVRYVFGGITRRGYVDSADVDGFLKIPDTKEKYSKKAFRLVPIPKAVPKSAPKPEPKPTIEVIEEKSPQIIVADKPKEDYRDPSDMSIKELRSYMADSNLSHESIKEMISLEVNGKARSSAIKTLENYLG